MTEVTFAQFAEFLRAWGRIPSEKPITPDLQFERDLGITGDDGCDLMLATGKHFNIRLSSGESGYRETFDLAEDEFLFNPEGYGFVEDILALFRTPSRVRQFTVGELYTAVDKVLKSGTH